MSTVETIERATAGEAVISGIGQSDVGRRLWRTGIDLTVDACLEAIADAGLQPGDIDGVACYAGSMSTPPGFSPCGVPEVREALRLELGWYDGAFESPSLLGSVVNACAAVNAGYARHVLCFRTVTEGTAQASGGRASVLPGVGTADGRVDVDGPWGYASWLMPFGAPSVSTIVAMYAQRHFHQYGTTREHLGRIALNARANAARNPKAIYREPLTLDDYLGARMISSPLGLYDCDVPCDGSTAVVVSHTDTLADIAAHPVRILSVGTAAPTRLSWDQVADLTNVAGLRGAAGMLWSRTELTPDDVDVAEIYDGFTYLTLAWLEGLGFCPAGESGPFVDDGNISIDGALPVNTHGGQLSAGRLSGFGFLHEACTQLRGQGGERQLGGPVGGRRPEVAVVSAGPGQAPCCLLLGR